VQQVFLRLAQSRQQGEIANPDAYVFQTAANTLRDHHRHTAVRSSYLADLASTNDGANALTPERVVLAEENLSLLIEEIRQLPERTADIVVLRCFEGLSNPEIAQLHGISTRAVEKHVAKALARLSQILSSQGTE
jgi:RNA polymerase sigma-70 factor (ECF subfamily)